MARMRAEVLSSNEAGTSARVLLWVAVQDPAQRSLYANSTLESAKPVIKPEDLTALRAGEMVERVVTLTWPSGTDDDSRTRSIQKALTGLRDEVNGPRQRRGAEDFIRPGLSWDSGTDTWQLAEPETPPPVPDPDTAAIIAILAKPEGEVTATESRRLTLAMARRFVRLKILP